MNDWAEKLAFARENGLTSVAFHPDGSLASFTRDPAHDGAAQPSAPMSAEERQIRQQQDADRYRRVLLGATSGLRPAGPRT